MLEFKHENKDLDKEKLEQLDHNELAEAYLKLQKEVTRQQEEIEYLQGELSHAKAMLFGRKTERREDNVADDQISFEFNEIESAAPADPDETEEVVVKEHTRSKKKVGKKAEDLSQLPKEEVHHSIPEDKLKEMFPEGWSRNSNTMMFRSSDKAWPDG